MRSAASRGTAGAPPGQAASRRDLHDQVENVLGPGTTLRSSDQVQAWGLSDAEVDAESRSIAYADDERVDALLGALAGQPRNR